MLRAAELSFHCASLRARGLWRQYNEPGLLEQGKPHYWLSSALWPPWKQHVLACFWANKIFFNLCNEGLYLTPQWLTGDCQHPGGHFPEKLSEPFCCGVHRGIFQVEILPHCCPATENKQERRSGSDKAITREPWRAHLTPSDCDPGGRREKKEKKLPFW